MGSGREDDQARFASGRQGPVAAPLSALTRIAPVPRVVGARGLRALRAEQHRPRERPVRIDVAAAPASSSAAAAALVARERTRVAAAAAASHVTAAAASPADSGPPVTLPRLGVVAADTTLREFAVSAIVRAVERLATAACLTRRAATPRERVLGPPVLAIRSATATAASRRARAAATPRDDQPGVPPLHSAESAR